MSSPVSFPVPSIAAGPTDPHSIVTACEDAELSGGGAGSEPRFVEVSLRERLRVCVSPRGTTMLCGRNIRYPLVFAGINMSRVVAVGALLSDISFRGDMAE